jgi:hypothetical protein
VHRSRLERERDAALAARKTAGHDAPTLGPRQARALAACCSPDHGPMPCMGRDQSRRDHLCGTRFSL